MRRPIDPETAIGRAQRGDADIRQQRGPAAIRPQSRPGSAPHSQHHGIGFMDGAIGETEPAGRPAGPFRAGHQPHAQGVQSPDPGAQERACFHRGGEHPAAAADKRGLPEPRAPFAQCLGRKGGKPWRDPLRVLAIAGQEARHRLGMGDVEAAPPGHQQLAPEARHALEHGHRQAALRHHLGGHQPGRTSRQ